MFIYIISNNTTTDENYTIDIRWILGNEWAIAVNFKTSTIQAYLYIGSKYVYITHLLFRAM